MTYVKTYLPTLKTHIINLKRDAKDLSCDLQRLEVRGKLGSKTLYCCFSVVMFCYAAQEQHKQTSTTNESISNTIELSLPRSLLWISPWRTYKWKIRLRWGSVWKLVHIHFHAALCILELRWGKGNFWVRQFIISVIFFSHLISLKAYWINCVVFTGVENLKQTRHILK